MAFDRKPVTGMRDILPREMEVRTALKGIIRDTYASYGFTEIETPIVEHAGNLTSNQGGENEKLIFRVLKRGEKLIKELQRAGEGGAEVNADDLSEEGLRYDLTLPLARYYAANSAVLPKPFKALQTGPVFRADRPQKGRFRQFAQYDIDILGDPTSLAEKELILATTEALEKIGFGKYGFYVVINDRRFLFELIAYAGLPEADAEQIFIELDKLDKVGAEGVADILKGMGYAEESVSRLLGAMEGCKDTPQGIRDFAARIGTGQAMAAGSSLADIVESVGGVEGRSIDLRFDPSLVRGMGYYTGTIFEIRTEALGSSVGGGGRYDKMIGKFTGQEVPAVGFSIGFERIMSIIMDGDINEFLPQKEKTAWLIEKDMPADRLSSIFNEANEERKTGKHIMTVWMAKNKKHQKESLAEAGYTVFRDFYKV